MTLILSRTKMLEEISKNPNHFHVLAILETFTHDLGNGMTYQKYNQNVIDHIKHCSKSHLILKFEDIEFPREGHSMVTSEQIKEAINYGKEKEDLIVACHAGISRSSGIAYLVECAKSNSPKIAIKILENKHYPNRKVVSLGTDVLGNKEIFNEYIRFISGKNDRL